jgi:hypothetical protein
MPPIPGSPHYVDELAEVVFPPGESPFKIRGSIYNGMFKREEKNPRSLKKSVDSLTDPALRRFLEQPFGNTLWYDIFPYIAICHRRAYVLGMSFHDFQYQDGRDQAEFDRHGVNKLLLMLISLESIALRMPTLVQNYFNFGSITAKLVEKRKVFGTNTGIPQPVHAWYDASCSGFVDQMMDASGGKKSSLAFLTPRAAQPQHGVAFVEMDYTITWE